MFKRTVTMLALSLIAATAAHAQYGGRGARGGGGKQDASSPSSSRPADAPLPPGFNKPVNEAENIGVIKGVDLSTNRITIAYEPIEAMNWPKGVMPFAVQNPALLKDITVGQKVRFRLDSQAVVDLKPY